MALVASLIAIAQLAQAIFEIPTGIVSDRFGRILCLRLGALASLASVICYAVGQNYWWLLIGVIFEGLNRAFFSGNNEALIYESLSDSGQKHKYQHEFGKTNSWLELSGFISGLVGGLVAIKSLSLLFSLSIIPQFVGVIISWWLIEPKKHQPLLFGLKIHLKSALKTYIQNQKVRLVSAASVIGFAIGDSTWSFQSLFYNLFLPTWLVSYVMSINFFTSTIGFRFGGKLLDKIKAKTVLFYGEIYGRVLYLISLIFPSVLSPFLMATASITYGPTTIAKSQLLQTEFTNHQRATMVSINSFTGNILYALVSVLIGFIADKYGTINALLLGQICLLSVVFIYYKLGQLTE